MKTLIIMTLFISSANVFSKPNLDKRKQKSLESIDKRINILSETKNCISSASTKEALRDCRKSSKSKMKALRDKNKAMREERKKNRKD